VSQDNSPRRVQNVSTDQSRRKALKIGAVAGAAGILSVAGIGKLSSSSSGATILASTKNLEALMSALIEQKLIEPYNKVDSLYIPGNKSVTVDNKVPLGYISIVNEDRIAIGQDHTVRLSVFIDGKQVLDDPDAVQARYDRSLKFLSGGSFYTIKEGLGMIVTNKTSKPRYFSSTQSGGRMLLSYWNSIVAPYLSSAIQR
jgi:hypothetical protein